MGCCASSNRSSSHSPSSPSKDNDPRSSISRAKSSENRAPPPVEEETVKEVLSETSKWKPSVAKFEAEKPSFDKFQGESKELEKKPFAEEISEVSEVCSLSESVSTLTTITDRREEDEEEETRRRRLNGSPARIHRNRSFSGERRDKPPGKSPARRSDQSPGKRNVGSARVVGQRRDQMGNGVNRNQPCRRDAGENSGRRSRSPATRIDSMATRSVVGRSPSARRTNNSPARVRTAAPESGGQKMESSTVEGKWSPPPSSSANESLENPLVSLECFIFL